MKYEIDIYENNSNNTLRFSLGKSGKRPLFVIGLNPSTADESKPDRTITKTMRFAILNDFDGFIMLNLYPQRATKPENLDKTFNQEYHNKNLKIITSLSQKYAEINILSAWGADILIRDYLKDCLRDIKKSIKNSNINWWQIGDLTKSGHPRHPSRAAYELGLKPMNIINYLMT